MATCPAGAERKVMLTWGNTCLDSKGWERNNQSSLPSIKNSAAEWFCEEKKAVVILPWLFPTEDKKMLLSLPKLLPLNLPTEPHPCWAVSNFIFQIYSLALIPVLAKGHKHSRVSHREIWCGLCSTSKLLSAILNPTITSNKIITPAKKTRATPIQQLKTRFWRNSCLARELQCTELEKENRNVWIVWVPKMLERTLWKTNITGGTITLIKPAGAVSL